MPNDPFGVLRQQRPDDIPFFNASGEWAPLHPPTAASFLTHTGSGDGLAWTAQASSGLDHGGLTGLGDDDHTQYRLESADHNHQSTGAQAGQLDHGLALTGLTDDDHTQYVLRSILTTNGDIYIRAAGAVTRLGVGSAGQVLGVASGLPAWQAQTQSHGASDHTDRTRRISLIPGAATIAVGAPDLAIRGANLRYAAWAFDSAADEVINFTFTLPDDYASSGQFLFWWTNGGAGAGNVVWAVRTRGVADAGDLNTTTGETSADDTIAAPAQNTVTASLHSAAPTLSAGEMVRLNIGRLGTAGGDTLGNDAWLLHVDFRYTADM